MTSQFSDVQGRSLSGSLWRNQIKLNILGGQHEDDHSLGLTPRTYTARTVEPINGAPMVSPSGLTQSGRLYVWAVIAAGLTVVGGSIYHLFIEPIGNQWFIARPTGAAAPPVDRRDDAR